MKLYAFQPIDHGVESFFVMSPSEREARETIVQYMKAHSFPVDDIQSFTAQGASYYVLTILEANSVIANDNG